MRVHVFFKQWGLLTAWVAIVGYLFWSSKPRPDIAKIYIIGVLLFSILNIVLFLFSKKFGHLKNGAFTLAAVLFSFLGKLILSIVLLLLFRKYLSPPDSDYVLHFVLIYVIYLVHEVYALFQLTRES